jgi:TAP-like protein
LTVPPQVPSAAIAGWPGVAAALQELWQAKDTPAPASGAAAAGASSTPPAAYAGPEQALAVECGDARNPPAEQFPALAGRVLDQSGPIGLVELWQDAPCGSWPVQTPAAYRGPWNTPTAAPILVVGNTGDPSTPYWQALEMVGALANARLLTVAGYGHTTFLNPSRCANDAEVAYFVDGTLPPSGTICQQDVVPFQPTGES